MWPQLDNQYIMNTVTRLPLTIKQGRGNYLYDTEENAYLDLFTGLGVNLLGHSHPRIVQTLKEQGERFLHISNRLYNPPAITLAQRIIENSLGQGKIYYCNSGAEATEAAIKLIDKWCQSRGNDRQGIVVVKNGFHGRTLGAIRVTRQPSVYQNYPVLDLPVFEMEPNQLDSFYEIIQKQRPAAVLVEPILGSGGVISLNKEYLQTIQAICHEQGMLFCMDEIQTGFGRTGKLFAYQHHGLQPDIVLFAKGVGGGLPLGGLIASPPFSELFQPGDHGTTFAPSPLSAALGNTVLDILLKEQGLQQANQVAEKLWNSLNQLKQKFPDHIQYLDGKGMMIGIHTSLSSQQVKQCQQQLLNQGILIDVTAQTVIRLLPPLTLTSEEVNQVYIQLDTWLQKQTSTSNYPTRGG